MLSNISLQRAQSPNICGSSGAKADKKLCTVISGRTCITEPALTEKVEEVDVEEVVEEVVLPKVVEVEEIEAEVEKAVEGGKVVDAVEILPCIRAKSNIIRPMSSPTLPVSRSPLFKEHRRLSKATSHPL